MDSPDFRGNVYNTLIQAARQWPNNIAVFDEHGDVTFAQLFEQTEILRCKLLSQNIEQGSSLVIIAKNSRHFITGLYAGIGCGCVVMPLAPYQKGDEISKALADAGIHYVLSENEEANHFGQVLSIIQIENQNFFLIRTNVSLENKVGSQIKNAAVMRFTSGTTADAKCVVLSHTMVIERIQAANEGLQLTENDRVIWVLPMAFHFIVSIMLYIRYGVGIIICDDFLAENILQKASACEGTMLYASPMHIRLLATSKDDIALPKLKMAISTTASISPSVCEAFETKYKLPVSQAFGIIEVGLPIINLKQSHENPAAVGYALPSFKVAVVDEKSHGLPPDSIGLLAIKGPGMFDGYLKPFRLREEVLRNGWFLTGDLASMDEMGLIEIKGRSKNMINVSGNKVFPAEVEDVINLYKGVINSKVYGKPHPLLGEMVIADVVLADRNIFDSENLISYCRQFLSPFKVPQRINVVDEIEITASGKVRRT